MGLKNVKVDWKKKRLLVALLALLMIASAIFGIWKYQQSVDPEVEHGAVRFESNYKTNAPGNLVFPAYTKDLPVEHTAKEIPIVLANPKVNKNVFFKYELFLIDDKSGKTDTKLGETKLIEAGYAANNFTVLSKKIKKLSKQKHKGRINVLAYTYNDKKKVELNQAHWDINLIIR